MTRLEENQVALHAALANLRGRLETGAASEPSPETPFQLARLASLFGLTKFESDVLLLAAGVELDSAFAAACATAQGDPALPFPTFGLALGVFDDAHWSALNPAAPLRYWRLIEPVNLSAQPLTRCRLRIDERVLHFLAGVQYLDERLTGFVNLVSPVGRDVASYGRHADAMEKLLSQEGPRPIIQLCSPDDAGRRSIAAAACRAASLSLYALAADQLPAQASDMASFLRIWEREAALLPSALYLNLDPVDRGDSRASSVVTRALEWMHCPVLIGARDRWHEMRRPVETFVIPKPAPEEQSAIWTDLLRSAGAAVNGHAASLSAQFNLSPAAIHASVDEALASGTEGEELKAALWDAGRGQSRPRLNDLAQRVEAGAQWDQLVLPAREKDQLRSICAHVRHRARVYGDWGFGSGGTRGLGISALFSGASGTGKTMAAEVLANELRLDLYRIDLSSVVSKYIGETEKNLRKVFDAAEEGGAILFFDEADALFGKRSEVKDSHDRYSNIEINYLLQRMETYRGLAVLATNMRSALDTAFLRRIRFVVNFPFPEAQQRAEIWERAFPNSTPREGLRHDRLAKLSLAGGGIRNIAMNAAFLAAAEGTAVRMSHLARAAREEFAKMEKPLPESEIGAWYE